MMLICLCVSQTQSRAYNWEPYLLCSVCVPVVAIRAYSDARARRRFRDMGKSAIAAAIADAGVEPEVVTALYVGNMLSGMLSDQQVSPKRNCICRTGTKSCIALIAVLHHFAAYRPTSCNLLGTPRSRGINGGSMLWVWWRSPALGLHGRGFRDA